MRSPVVLCVEYESYISAVAAMRHVVASLGPCELVNELSEAMADLKRAYAASLAIDSRITPALLKRQAG